MKAFQRKFDFHLNCVCLQKKLYRINITYRFFIYSQQVFNNSLHCSLLNLSEIKKRIRQKKNDWRYQWQSTKALYFALMPIFNNFWWLRLASKLYSHENLEIHCKKRSFSTLKNTMMIENREKNVDCKIDFVFISFIRKNLLFNIDI